MDSSIGAYIVAAIFTVPLLIAFLILMAGLISSMIYDFFDIDLSKIIKRILAKYVD